MKARVDLRRKRLEGAANPAIVRRANPKAPWEERFAVLFEDLRKPARVLVNRTYASAISAEEIEDVYANAWTSTLKTLGGRERHMPDHELRSYVLTAVANHASKEMRRRSRRPVSELEEAHVASIADASQPAPDELAVDAEAHTVVRDLLASLPPRRRAVILLRYGWGMAPREICTSVPGLSARAYRKEISKGVEELIERIGLHESGEWCRSREPLLRDYVAGVADEDAQRQATHHLAHCHSCSELVGRLSSGLHDLGSTLGWTAVVGSLGGEELSIVDRVGAGVDRLREQAAGVLDGGQSATETAATIGAAGGTRGAGTAAGGGLLATIGGGGAKLAALCGGTAAAGACVAAVALPTGIDPFRSEEPEKSKLERRAATSADLKPKVPKLTPTPSIDTYEPRPEGGGAQHQAGSGGGSSTKAPPARSAGASSTPARQEPAEVAPAAAPPPVAAQTDPVAAAAAAAPAGGGGSASSGTTASPAPSGGSGGSGGSGARGAAGGEFGP